jgi:hypothetical protein
MDKVLVAAIVFYAIYQILKNFTDFLLKRKIIRAGHYDRAGILDQQVGSELSEVKEVNKYPSLKWGLVVFFGGLGFILIDQMSPGIQNYDHYHNYLSTSMLPFGIELVCISLGFIIYFLIVSYSKRK